MAVTVSFDLSHIKSEFIVSYSANIVAGGDLNAPDVMSLADGGYAISYVWSSSLDYSVLQERHTAEGTVRPGPPSGVSIIDLAPYTVAKSDPAITQLTGGGILTTWTVAASGIHYAITDPATGGITSPDALLDITNAADVDSDVAALQNGGFALVKQDNVAANDQDADVHFYGSTGVLQSAVALGDNSGLDERAPAVTVLSNGNVAIAYEKQIIEGTDTYGMAIEIYTQAGALVLDQTMFDAANAQNRRPDIVALDDGGFAVGYEDNEYSEAGVTVWFFNADGSTRGRARADSGFFVDTDVKLSKLANGYVVATWTDNGVDIVASILDPATQQRIGGPFIIEDQSGQQEQSSVAGLANGTFVTAWKDFNRAIEDGNTDPNKAHISMQIDAFRRLSVGDAADDTIIGDALIDNITGGGGNDTLHGGSGKDALRDGAGTDFLDGGADDDLFFLDADGVNDTVAGDAGAADVLDLYYATATTIVSFGAVDFAGTASGGGQGTTSFTGIERVHGSTLIDTVTGGGGGEYVNTRAGADTVNAGGGADTVYGDAGIDRIYGGLGNDRIDGGGDGDAWLGGDAGADTITGGLGNDRIDGGADGDIALNGEAGNDTITGGDGDDTANGGTEDDIIYGQAGRDTIRGGAGVDTLYGGDEAGAGDILLAGEAGADHVQGGLGDDRIDGGSENDKLHGEAGNDTVTGGLGNDRLEGGADVDVLYGEADNDYILGGAGNDTLYGGAGIDYLYGDAADDFLQGDGGNDNLRGGAGFDRFNFDLANGSDAIFDFTNDQDTLIIDPLFGFATAAAVLAATIQTGTHARILLPGAATDIYLWNYLAAGSGNTIANLADDIMIA